MTRDRQTIPTTCAIHGARGFTNLAVSRDGGDIVLDPHTAGACVLLLDEAAAAALRDAITELLG